MPKSRRRKQNKPTVLKMPPEAEEAINAQREAFRRKFGRDWGPGDPVFFDPDADQPTPMSSVRLEAEILEAMRKAGTPPEIIYAYKKTGLLLVEGSPASPSDR